MLHVNETLSVEIVFKISSADSQIFQKLLIDSALLDKVHQLIVKGSVHRISIHHVWQLGRVVADLRKK